MVSLMSVPAVLTATLPPAQLGAAFKAEHAKADAIIGYAARVQDWPLLEQAVDEKIAEQKWFVEEWWDKNVGANWGGNRSKNADTAFLNVQRAETATGISQQQVARWRKELRNPDKYREKLILAACRKAGLKSAANHRAEGTGENEWYTPTEYVEAAREVMGAIDLGYRIILIDGALCSTSDESHDAILALYRQRFDIQVGVATIEEILDVWRQQ